MIAETVAVVDGVDLSRLVDHGRDPRNPAVHCYGAQRATDGAWRWLWLEGTRFVRWSDGAWHMPKPGAPSGWVSVP